jgi:hypothetical protein
VNDDVIALSLRRPWVKVTTKRMMMEKMMYKDEIGELSTFRGQEQQA